MIPAVEFRDLSKSFSGIKANEKICLKVQSGSIHAIVGENGAGKSTAMKMLYGTFQPDSGDILIHGKLWGGRLKPWSSPSDAIQCGIGMVHQHFMLGGPHSVLDNILLGFEQSLPRWRWLPRSFRPMDRDSARQRLNQLSEQYGLFVDWDAKVESLSVGIQQRIEILKLLFRNAQILILDEPTAVLTPKETADLFVNLRKLCQQGKTVILITHKLKEVMNLANRVAVFRAGKVIGEREIQDTDVEDLASLMVGRKVNLRGEVPPPSTLKAPVLEMSNVCLNTRRKLVGLDLQVRGGEVVGIAGVEGNGQSELVQLLLHPKDHISEMSGSIRIFDKDVRVYSTEQVKGLGMGVIPEDRHRDGLLLDRPVSENFLLGLQKRSPFNIRGILSVKALEQATYRALEEYDIRPKSIQIRVGALSGGNQQKVVIAREFKYAPRLIIASQPTRGVDVGAIEFIHKQILNARSEGTGVLLISSELDEILALSDRIMVMYEGKFVAEFSRGEATEQALGLRMGGALSL